jgi:glycosyltransferase involved in cell wall biosynthesis
VPINEWVPVFSQADDRPLRLGHAPTNRAVKGTSYLLAAVERLKREGFIFDFTLIEGVSNREAVFAYKSLDVLIDQLFAGWYGGVAVEAMALGKPVVCYIRESDMQFVPGAMVSELPVIRAEPSTIYEVLKAILLMPRVELLSIAKRSREYVERWHNPAVIAQRVRQDLDRSMRLES